MSSPKDMFGFDDGEGLPASAISEETLAADDKTLRLAAPLVTAEALDGFVRYQVELAARVERGEGPAEAHPAALQHSGLTSRVFEPLRAFVNDFAGRRSAVRALKAKLAERRQRIAQQEAAGEDVPQEQQDLVWKLTTELARLDTLAPLQRRYGQQAVALVADREDELLRLHALVARLHSGR